MIDPDFFLNIGGKFKQIEDIIDSRKLLGQYNVDKQSGINCRYVYSSFSSAPYIRCLKFDDNMLLSEGDPSPNSHIKQTDSEITVVRIKCNDLAVKRCTDRNKWDLQDIAVPGDGSHLGESPSMVNLATLVGDSKPFDGEEYLVPLSSWDPYFKLEDIGPEMKCCSDSTIIASSKKNESLKNRLKTDRSDLVCVRQNWAGRLSKFIRKHCTKTKTLSDKN